MDSTNLANPANQPSKNRVNKSNRKTLAARYNSKILRGLQDKLLKDPEADITTGFSTYSQKLESFKQPTSIAPGKPVRRSFDIRSRLQKENHAEIIFPLSSDVQSLCCGYESLTEAIIELISDAEVLFESAWAASVMVFKVNSNLVIKAGHQGYTTTEHQTLTYLQDHIPSFPAPRPHGLVNIGAHCFLFQSYIPGISLEAAWPQLDFSQKRGFSHQIDLLLSELRSLPFMNGTPMGDVAGGGCRDCRSSTRISKVPIMNVKEFEDFIFAGSDAATPTYVELLRNLMPNSTTTKIVFTHGDIRPANIMVDRDQHGTWKIIAMIDWETAGFYPEYWEAVKATNLLTPRDHFGWYKFIPQSISAKQYPIPWLVDRVWDRSVSNGTSYY